MISRRHFLTGAIGLIAAPYVIRNSGILMPVRNLDNGTIFYVSKIWWPPPGFIVRIPIVMHEMQIRDAEYA